MKNTAYKLLLSVFVTFAQVIAPSLSGRAGGESLYAQEAFYIYRNDGDFNGFFFDEIKRMGYSKLDLDGIEHDVYVVQEVELADTIYRIPLSAIDSIGFQQPDIILNERLYNLADANCPYSKYWYNCSMFRNCFYYERDADLYEQASAFYPIDEETYVISWDPWDEEEAQYDISNLPKVGDILSYYYYNSYYGQTLVDGVAKVVAVKCADPDFPKPNYYIYMKFVENFGDVFEQLISVEQLGKDENGQAVRRMAGLNKVKQRVSGTKDVTLVSLSGTFPIPIGGTDTFQGSLNINLALEMKARAVYNISRRDFNINIDFEENAEVGATLVAKGTLEDVTTWKLGGAPIYFPSFLPVLQVDPAPGAFLKTTGEMNLKLTTPKLKYAGKQSINISPKGIRGSNSNNSDGKKDDDNGWKLELSLDGSAHAGTHFPFNIETNTWAKKIFWCSTGIDVYVGPKLSASFTLDPVALANGENIYATFGGTNISYSPICAAYEATAKFSTGTQYEEEFKIFEGEANLGQMTLKLFPEFEKTLITKKEKTYREEKWHGSEPCGVYGYYAETVVRPRGLSVPYYVGAAVYDSDKNYIVGSYYNDQMFSFFNAYDKTDHFDLPLFHGKFYIVPIINVFGYRVPAWSEAQEVTSTLELGVSMVSEDGMIKYNGDLEYTHAEGWINVTGLMPDDNVELTIEENDPYKQDLKIEKGEKKQGNEYLESQSFWFEYNYTPGTKGRDILVVKATGKDGSKREKRLYINY